MPIDREKIAAFCRKHGIRKLSLFGSVLRDDFRPDSDVDVLVVWEPDARVGLKIFDIERELSAILGGRKVDLINEKYLDRYIRDEVMASLEVAYAAA
ncbi:MAG: nucleotidyltransferase domain-containing protein [Candidatus Methylomirabilis sp.]|nr:nucleotidyltransferase domain-containing protein [Deltaproteobacteria bacterium]